VGRSAVVASFDPRVLTTTPNVLTSNVHDRMPVVLDPGSYNLWLDPGMRNASAASDPTSQQRDGRLTAMMRLFKIGHFSQMISATLYDEDQGGAV
jgi:putative SOS response-associated peptidase YedK